MKHKIVLVPFPFDDLSTTKVRPAVCLTDEVLPYGHVVLAFVTSRVSDEAGSSDLIIDTADKGFAGTGLKVASTIRLHRLMTVTVSIIRRELGNLSADHIAEINIRLKKLFDI